MKCPVCGDEAYRSVVRYVANERFETCTKLACRASMLVSASHAGSRSIAGQHSSIDGFSGTEATGRLFAGCRQAEDGTIVDTRGRPIHEVYGGDSFDADRRKAQQRFLETRRPERLRQKAERDRQMTIRRAEEWKSRLGSYPAGYDPKSGHYNPCGAE